MYLKRILPGVAPLALIGACSDSDPVRVNDIPTSAAARDVAREAAVDVQAAALAAAANNSWLTLRGKVISAQPSSFQLAAGDETVTVEMDDWDWYQEGRALKAGDEVVVSGRVDQDLMERKRIEASSVFVRNLGVHFYASSADEEVPVSIVYTPSPTPFTDASGIVTDVEGREFTVGVNTAAMRVDTSQVAAPAKVKVGDRVYAWGNLDLDPEEKLELMAEGVVIISKDKTKSSTAPQPAKET
jgi:uncharacterized protein YdeI (BOF family)